MSEKDFFSRRKGIEKFIGDKKNVLYLSAFQVRAITVRFNNFVVAVVAFDVFVALATVTLLLLSKTPNG